jgi:6-phosphofructokinase 1
MNANVVRRVALSTGGGDAPGLNAVIRAAVMAGLNHGWEMLGIRKGFDGLLGDGDVTLLDRESVRGITHLGGTILGTTNRGNPFSWPVEGPDGAVQHVDRSRELIGTIERLGIDAIIAIGGDGTLRIAERLCELGVPIVGVPKTIDNDLAATSVTLGAGAGAGAGGGRGPGGPGRGPGGPGRGPGGPGRGPGGGSGRPGGGGSRPGGGAGPRPGGGR